MLSYLHKYHAGNFADLHKQILLTATLSYFTQKAKPFRIIDTHGGEGYYLLSDAFIAQNNRELHSGLAVYFNHLEKLLQSGDAPALLHTHAQLLKKWNPNNKLVTIPGSPLLFSDYLRADSTLLVCEKHPSVFAQLETNFSPQKPGFKLLNESGYQATKAYLPPLEKRGLVFIDPSYEEKTEYEQIADCLIQAIKRFSTGTYIVWYPVLNNQPKDGIHWLIRRILKLPIHSLWQHEWFLEAEFNTKASGFHALQGSGLLCIQLPWQVDNDFITAMDWLNTYFFPGRKCTYQWLKQAD